MTDTTVQTKPTADTAKRPTPLDVKRMAERRRVNDARPEQAGQREADAS